MTTAAPVPVPLPPPGDGVFSEAQWRTLFALVDAAIPPIVPEAACTDRRRQLKISQGQYDAAYDHVRSSVAEPPERDRFKEYLRSQQSANPRFVDNVKRTMGTVPEASRSRLARVLDMMEIGAFIVTGYCTPFSQLPLHRQHAVIQSWTQAWSPIWPTLSRVFASLAQKCFSQADPLYQQLIGYTAYPEAYQPGRGFAFDFRQFDAGSEPAAIDADVVIVGSGCGGAVCAKVLSEAGHRVLVVDKGYHFEPSQFPMEQESGSAHLFENRGILNSDDSSFNLLAGSCWGGGGTVNWSVSLEPEDFVRKEWADGGLPLFQSGDFQESLDRVQEFMGVSDANIRHNHAARVLLEGSQKLGFRAKPCPLNAGGEDHYCGRCPMGCMSGGKRGPAVSWLPAAAAAGAQFIEGLEVSRVLFEESGDATRRATGLVGTWTSRDAAGGLSTTPGGRRRRRVHITAKKVIVAAGSLQSPLLLLRSGLENEHIGKNLHLHPCNYVLGRFDEDIRPWEGGVITAVCEELNNLDGHGHGVNLETTSMIVRRAPPLLRSRTKLMMYRQPFMVLANLPWRSGLDFKLNALKLRNMNCFISLTRDRDSGRVHPDPVSGGPRIDYTTSAFDRAHTMAGVVALARLCYAQGAREIHALLPAVEPFVRDDAGKWDGAEGDDGRAAAADAAFEAWLARVEKAGNAAPATPWGSAHQMGTCRMSSGASGGVVDPRGRVWGARGLYVADSSVFPSASGVNPMITTMALADGIARGVAGELAGKQDEQDVHTDK